MMFKKIILISLLLFVLSVSAVSAADSYGVYNSSLSTDDSILGNADIQYPEISLPKGSFQDLQKEVDNASEGSVLNLNRDYVGTEAYSIQLDKNLTIDGHGHTLDCLGEYDCNTFNSNSGTITLKNLKIINGHNDYTYMGGAILIWGSAQYTIENCIFNNNWADNYGGAIYNGANNPLTIINCQFNNNEADDNDGGAIYSRGDIIVMNSSFISNKACDVGGAIYCESKNLIIDNCTFKDNHAGVSAGAIRANCIYINFNQTVQSYNSFFIDNSVDSLLSALDAGVIYGSSVYLKNAVFTGNHAYCTAGAISTCFINCTNCLFESNDIKSSHGGAIYVRNGESYIQNSIFNSNVADQCGGAVYSTGDLFVDNCTFYNNFASIEGGAVRAKNVYINTNQGNVSCFSTFKKNSVYGYTMDSNDGGAVFAEEDVKIVNTYFNGNSAKVDGGAVFCEGTLNADNCFFESNEAQGSIFQCYGGAIRAEDDAIINNCTFKDNHAEDYGGAVYAKNVYINKNQDSDDFNSFFIKNNAGDDKGGAVFAEDNVNAVNTMFNGNSAKVDGGAVYAEDNVNVKHCWFESNQANGAKSTTCYGGAIRAEDDATINNCTFIKNYAENKGGAVYASKVILENTPSYFEYNTARDYGGAIYTNKFDKDVKYAVFINNKAETEDGGAIYINSENWITFSQCVFVNNHCGDEGGAIYLDSSRSHLTLRYNIFRGNSADDEGQTVYNCGNYDQIINNFWYDNNPSSSNDQLIEWKFLVSNAHHSDSDPLKMALDFTSDCNVNQTITVTLRFCKSNGNSFIGRLFDLESVLFSSNPELVFKYKNIISSDIMTLVTPQNEGIYIISATLYGYTVSKVLVVSRDQQIF